MSRAAITVNYGKLQELINQVEGKETYANITSLCHAVSEADTALTCALSGRRPKQIHYGQVYLAIKSGHVTATTKKGKRGAQTGEKRDRKSRADKFVANDNIKIFLDNVQKDAPEKYQPLVEKAREGSTVALIKLKCIQCFGYEGGHTSCDANGTTQPPCALYPLNLLYFPTRKDLVEYDPMSKK